MMTMEMFLAEEVVRMMTGERAREARQCALEREASLLQTPPRSSRIRSLLQVPFGFRRRATARPAASPA